MKYRINTYNNYLVLQVREKANNKLTIKENL